MTEPIDLGAVQIEAADYAIHGNAILGIKDSGKSYTATFFAERLMDAGIPIIAVDPIGIWRFLRAAGAGAGYPVVVAGGRHGDLPLTPATTADIVRAAMQQGISLVLDLYSIELSKADWKRIVIAALDVLLYENASLRHLFIEEAAEFAPQRVGRDQGHVYSAMEKLTRMGGNAQLGYTLINQRAEELNKAVLEICDNLFLHRQKGRNSITALKKWLRLVEAEGAAEIVPSLPMLEQGECWAWLAGSNRPRRVRIPAKRTLHPDRRLRREAGVPIVMSANADHFIESMRASLEAAAAKAAAPTKAAPAKAGAKIDASEIASTLEAVARLERQLTDLQADREAERQYSAGLLDRLHRIAEIAAEGTDGRQAPVRRTVTIDPRPPRLLPTHAPAVARASKTIGTGPLHAAARGMLATLAQHAPARLTWAQVATLAGLKARGGHFNAGRKDLLTRGLVEEQGALVAASKAGMREAGVVPARPTTPAEILALWCGRLPAPAPAMLRHLVSRRGAPVTRDELAQAIGKQPIGGHWNGGVAVLRNNGLIEASGNTYRAARLLIDGVRP